MKNTVRLTGIAALLVVLCLMTAALSPVAMAARAEDKVYYSDLFYGYSNEYLLSDYLNGYAVRTSDVMWELYEEYMNDGGSIWTTIASAVGVAASPHQLYLYLCDYIIGTTFTYDNVLDAANADFLFKMMDGGSPLNTDTPQFSYSRVIEALEEFGPLFENACEELEPEMSDTDSFLAATWATLEDASEAGKFLSLSATQLQGLFGIVGEDLADAVGSVSDMLETAQALYLGLIIEDVRLSMLDAIVSNAEPGSTLHTGMSRLRSQVQANLFVYFFDNYITKGLLNDIMDLVGDAIPSYKIASGIFEIAKTVAFDWVLDIPDIDALLKQTVLAEYSRDLYLATVEQMAVFAEPFDPNEVFVFEDLTNALIAATSAGLEATEPIAMTGNRYRLENIVWAYEDMSYAFYIENVKDLLSAKDREDREVKTYASSWWIPENASFDKAADNLHPNCIYMFEGAALGDYVAAYPTNLCTLSGCPLVLEGDLTVRNCTVTAPKGQEITMERLTVHSGGVLQNQADLTCSELTVTPAYNAHSIVSNSHKLNIEGDLTLNHDEDNYVFGWLYGYLCQAAPTAEISVGGDIYAEKAKCFDITDGLFVLNGDNEQRVTNLAAHHLMFDNPDGIEYGSDISVTGEFAPSRDTEDDSTPMMDNGHYVRLLSGGTVAQRSDTCGNIQLSGGTLTTHCTVDQLYIAAASTLSGVTVTANDVFVRSALTVAADAELAADGELMVYAEHTVTNNGTIRCEDLTLEADALDNSHFYNNGQLFISGDMMLQYDSSYPVNYGYFHQTESTAATYAEGDILTEWTNCFDVTAGAFELCGTRQQQLSNLEVCDLTVSNPAGARYLTDVTVHGRFSPGSSPLDCGEHWTVLKTGASLSGGTDTHGRVMVFGTVSLGSGTVDALHVHKSTATVDAGEELTVLGDLTVINEGVLINNGTVRCTNLLLAVNYDDSDLYNNGRLFVAEDILLEDDYGYPANTGCLHQTTAEAALFLGDELQAAAYRCWDVTAGAVNSAQVDRTIALIDAIGTVTIDREGAVAEARAAYTALHYNLHPYVTNYSLLTAAETALAPIVESVNALTFSASAQGQQVVASVTSGKGELPALTVLVCLYDEEGKFLSCTMLPVAPVKQGQTADLYVTAPEDALWKSMLVTPAGLRPLSEYRSGEY